MTCIQCATAWSEQCRRQRVLEQSSPRSLVLRVTARGMNGVDHFENHPPRNWSPLHQIRDVLFALSSIVLLEPWQDIVVYKDAQMLEKDEFLGVLADTNGHVELSTVRIDPIQNEQTRAALARAAQYAREGLWSDWSREHSEADRLAALSEHMSTGSSS